MNSITGEEGQVINSNDDCMNQSVGQEIFRVDGRVPVHPNIPEAHVREFDPENGVDEVDVLGQSFRERVLGFQSVRGGYKWTFDLKLFRVRQKGQDKNLHLFQILPTRRFDTVQSGYRRP